MMLRPAITAAANVVVGPALFLWPPSDDGLFGRFATGGAIVMSCDTAHRLYLQRRWLHKRWIRSERCVNAGHKVN